MIQPKKKIILDTNGVIHFVAAFDIAKFNAVAHILTTEECCVPIEVIAEAVYVMEKVLYKERREIADKLKDFVKFKDDLVAEAEVVLYGLNMYAATKLDFVDCLMVGYAKVKGNPVFTFDSDLKKQLEHKAYHG